jgi:hypothetical protein
LLGVLAALAVAGLLLAAMIVPHPGHLVDSANVSGACAAKTKTGARTRSALCPTAAATAPASVPTRVKVPHRHRAPHRVIRPLHLAGTTACDIIVPANPLTAAGLATPYQLTGPHGGSAPRSGCKMANSVRLGAFVQATILDPATGALRVYEPLVITKGTKPALAPVVPRLPAHAVVTIDFGFNGTSLTQVGATRYALRQGNCVNGLPGSIFGQVSFCNGRAFFAAAFAAERAGKLVVPAAGVSARTHQACPTTRSFDIVDQDPSDNVTTTYLLTRRGRTAQFSTASVARLPHPRQIGNGSDNALLDGFVDPSLGCTPFRVPDLSQHGSPGTSQALDELTAARDQAPPVALVPENDEMVLAGNDFSVPKTNLYRASVGQPPVSAATSKTSSPAMFCQNMTDIQARFLARYRALLAKTATPVPPVGDNLFTFMANRLSMSFVNLDCNDYGLVNPVHVRLNPAGVAVAATFDTTWQRVKAARSSGRPPAPCCPARRTGRRSW